MAGKREIFMLRTTYQEFRNSFIAQFRLPDTTDIITDYNYESLKKVTSVSRASKNYNTAKDLGIATRDGDTIRLTPMGEKFISRFKLTSIIGDTVA